MKKREKKTLLYNIQKSLFHVKEMPLRLDNLDTLALHLAIEKSQQEIH
jgi:hypothetical protein